MFHFIKQSRYSGYSRTDRMKYLIIILLTFISCISFYIQKKQFFYHMDQTISKGSLGDYIVFLIGGNCEKLDDLLHFPVSWIFFHIFLIYGTIDRLHKDLSCSFGMQILVKSGSRKRWWDLKAYSSLFYIIKYYIAFYLTIFIFCMIFERDLGLHLTKDLISPYMTPFYDKVPGNEFAGALLLLAPLYSISLVMLQMCLTLFLRPVISFLLIAMYILMTIPCKADWVLGNYAMPVRSEYIRDDGMHTAYGILVCLIVCLGSYFIGRIRFSRYDILEISD